MCRNLDIKAVNMKNIFLIIALLAILFPKIGKSSQFQSEFISVSIRIHLC